MAAIASQLTPTHNLLNKVLNCNQAVNTTKFINNKCQMPAG